MLGYNGKQSFKTNPPKVTITSNQLVVPSIVTQMPEKDSLQVWYKPLKADTLAVNVMRDNYKEEYIIRVKDQKKDSLDIKALQNGVLNFRDRFTLEASTPLVKFDKSKIQILSKDSTAVDFTTEYDDFNQKFYLDFKKEVLEQYRVSFLPGALTDFFEQANDSLNYNLTTKTAADYANLRIQLQNVKRFPVIVQLTNSKGDVIASEYSEEKTTVDFNLVEPTVLTLRLIYDDNKNGIYDTGSYLQKRYSEEVIYSSKEINIHANFDWEETFDVSLPYTPPPKEKVGNKKKSSF